MVDSDLQDVYGAIVVGGGISGLWSALTLSKKGLSTLLLEKSPQLGGTCRTIALKGNSGQEYFADLGPHAITGLLEGPFNYLKNHLHPDKIPRFKPHNYYFRERNGDLKSFPNTLQEFLYSDIISRKDKIILAKELFYSVTANSLGLLKDRTLDKLLSKYDFDARTHKFVEAFARFVSGVDAKNTTVSRTLDACGFNSDDGALGKRIKGFLNLVSNSECKMQGYPVGPGNGKGIQTIVDCIVDSFPSNASYHVNEPVRAIEKTGSGFDVYSDKGSYSSKRVIYSGEAKKLPEIMAVPEEWSAYLPPLKQANAIVLCLGVDKKIFPYEGSEIFFDTSGSKVPYWAMPVSNTDSRLAPIGKQLIEFSTILEPGENADTGKNKLRDTIIGLFPEIESAIDMEFSFAMPPEKAAVSSYPFPPHKPFEDRDLYLVGTDTDKRSMGLTRAGYSVIEMLKAMKLYDRPIVC